LDDFGREVNEFINEVIKMCKESTKKIAGNEVDGLTFALFLKDLVVRLNANETVFVHSSYELIMTQLTEEKTNAAKQLFQTKVDQMQLPKESSELKSDLEKTGKQVLETLNASTSLTQKELHTAIATYRAFETKQIDLIVQINDEKIYAYNVEKVLDPKFKALVELVSKDACIKTYDQFERELNKCREFSAKFFAGDHWRRDVEKYMESKKEKIELLEELVQRNSEVKGSENDQNKKTYLEQIGDLLVKMTPLAIAVLEPLKPSKKDEFYERITPVARLLSNTLSKPDTVTDLPENSASASQVNSKIKPLRNRDHLPTSNGEIDMKTPQKRQGALNIADLQRNAEQTFQTSLNRLGVMNARRQSEQKSSQAQTSKADPTQNDSNKK
jgi:hypothetical protein